MTQSLSDKATSAENPGAGQGSVVLDIGAGFGALVVAAPAKFSGRELEICPAGRRFAHPDDHPSWWGGDGHVHGWPHVEVLSRPTPGGTVHAAVFPSLQAGEYDVWVRPDGPILVRAEIRGGEVTEMTVD